MLANFQHLKSTANKDMQDLTDGYTNELPYACGASCIITSYTSTGETTPTIDITFIHNVGRLVWPLLMLVPQLT